MREYPQSKTIRFDAYSVITAWASLGLSVILLILVLAGLPFLPLLLAASTLFLLSAAAHLLLAFAHRCPECSKHPTIQGFAPVHPQTPASAADGWAGVVLRVVGTTSLFAFTAGRRTVFRVPPNNWFKSFASLSGTG